MSSISSHQQEERFVLSGFSWLIPIGLSVLLIITSQFNFLLFHTLAELFAIIVAVLMCVVAWQMYPFTRNNYLMYLGVGYFWIGVLDMAHAISFKGMSVFPGISGDVTVQFWIATRYIEALLLLSAPWYLAARLNYRLVFFVFSGVTALIFLAVSSGNFPEMYVEGQGLTATKIYSEYLIIAILIAAAWHLWKKRDLIDERIIHIMLLSVMLTACAELAFTFYIDLHGLSNLVGHIFKLFSYWLIFMAMVRTTLQEPFTVMSRGANTYDAVPDATIMVDKNGLIYQVNNAACKYAGSTRRELIGRSSHDCFHPHDSDTEDCEICQHSRHGKKITNLEIENKENNQWLDYTISPVAGLTELDGSVEIIRDITDRKQVEDELDDVNELKNSIVENLPAVLFVKRAEDHCYVEWNKAAEELTGVDREEMLGKNDFDFFTEDEAAFYVGMDKKVLSEGRLHVIPEEPIHTRNKGVRLVHTRKIPIYNKQGKASFLLGISQDITEQRETEEMLRRSQKMEAVGQLSGGIAHDFNNQLGIVTGYLEFLKAFVKDNEKQLGWVESASKAAQRCVELTKQLLLFSRAKPAGKTDVDINFCINGIEDIIEKSVTPEVNVSYQLEPELWQVSVDQGELEDAIVNMVINARDAMPDGGEIIIRTSKIYLDNDFVSNSPGVRSGEYSMLEIKDSGFGMSEEVIEHIFEPFYTTKPVGKGTGLGMSMVYGFVQRYDGSINIDSMPGAGSSIKMYLPRTSEEETESNKEVEKDRVMMLPQGTETVLVVDDEIDLLNLASEYLETLGYRTFKASNASEAIGQIEKEKIDIVFTDIVMPGGMNGYELADKVRNDYPEIKVLLSSGYTGKSTGTVYKAVYKELIVSKPYTRQDLAYRIRNVLES